MAPLRSPRIVGKEVLEDQVTGKHFLVQERDINITFVDQNEGTCSLCTVKGDPVAKFHLGTTGVATKQERRERGLGDFSNIAPEVDLFNVVLPEKFLGYGHCPRPEIEIDVVAEFPYKMPLYLRPKPPKVGTVKTKTKKPPPPKLKWRDARPTFLNCMDSQFAPTVKMSMFLGTVTNELASWDDVHTLTAKNKQLLLDSQEDPLDALRQQRTSTKNRFNSKHPPFNPQEIQKRENLRDKQINPSKYKAMQKAYLLDKEGVDQRRRDRYMQFFVEKDEQAKLLAAQQALVEAQ